MRFIICLAFVISTMLPAFSEVKRIGSYSSPAQWIWDGKRPFGEKGFFRRTILVQGGVKSAFIQMTGDDWFVLYLNGKRIGEGGGEFYRGNLKVFSIGDMLRQGRNVIAVECTSPVDPAGMIMECTINYEDGGVEIIASDENWKFSREYQEGWEDMNFDDSHWGKAVPLGRPPLPPWGPLRFRYMGGDVLRVKVLEVDFPRRAKGGDLVFIRLRGKILSPPRGDHLGFLRLFKRDIVLIEREALLTHPPTSACSVGDEFSLSLKIQIPPYAPSGIYELEVGLHQSQYQGREDYIMGKMEIEARKSELPLAEIKELNGSPCLFINGKPFFPMIYSQIPHPDEKHSHQFAKAGVELYEINDTLGFIHTSCWEGKDKYDFSRLDNLVLNVLKSNPKAYFLLRLWLEPPEWWKDLHPQELQLYADGTGWDKVDVFGGTKWPSFASEVWRKEAGNALRALINHIKGSPYAERCIGFHIGAGIYGEWHYMGAQYVPDMSEPMRRRFRKWLRERYGNDINALRRAWGKEDVDFETAEIPTLQERLRTSWGIFHDPSKNRQVVDYYLCHHDVLVETILYFAKIAKEATEGKSLVGVFYGYTANVLWAQDGGHLELQKIYNSPYIDFLCSPHTYIRRSLGEDGGFRALPGSIALHGKIFIDEADDRTHLASDPYARGVEDSIALIRREFIQALTTNAGLWWFDMESRWFDDPRLMEEIKKMKRVGDESLRLPRRRMSEVAVIASPYNLIYTAHWRHPKYADERTYGDAVSALLLNEQWGEFFKMGAPFDLYDLGDIERLPTHYKCYIFLNTFYMEGKARRAIERLKRDGKILIWFYAPGILGEKGIDLEGMEELVGMRMGMAEKETPLEVVTKDGRRWGVAKAIAPTIWVEDREAEVLGSSPEGKANFCLKRFKDWVSVYVGSPALPADILRELLKSAGVHIYLESGDVLYLNDSYLALHTAKAGVKKITLPKARRVRDVFEDRDLGILKEWEVYLPAHWTVLYQIR